MANLHKLSVQEAVNTDTAAAWDVETVVTTTDATVTHINVSSYHNIIVDTTSTIFPGIAIIYLLILLLRPQEILSLSPMIVNSHISA